MRIDVIGELHRYRTIKGPRGQTTLGSLLAEVLMHDMHKRGELPDKFYYPEWACVSVPAGCAPDPFWRHHGPVFRFGKSGTACKKHWQPLRDRACVRLVAEVEPYQNRCGGSVKRVVDLSLIDGEQYQPILGEKG